MLIVQEEINAFPETSKLPKSRELLNAKKEIWLRYANLTHPS